MKFVAVLFGFLIITSYSIEDSQISFGLKSWDNFKSVGDTISVDGNIIKLNKLQFYVSHLKFYNDSNLVWADSENAHLLDFGNVNGLFINHHCKQPYNKITFVLGIDSATNCSGAYGGDLDPTKGMYWSWHSGYINFKLEFTEIGKSNSKFQYHLGGYQKPHLAAQKMSFNLKENCNNHKFNLKLTLLLKELLKYKKQRIMSPGADAKEFSIMVVRHIKYDGCSAQ